MSKLARVNDYNDYNDVDITSKLVANENTDFSYVPPELLDQVVECVRALLLLEKERNITVEDINRIFEPITYHISGEVFVKIVAVPYSQYTGKFNKIFFHTFILTRRMVTRSVDWSKICNHIMGFNQYIMQALELTDAVSTIATKVEQFLFDSQVGDRPWQLIQR